MPRSGWLAIGAVIGALGGAGFGATALVAAVGLSAAGLCLVPTSWRRPAKQLVLAAVAAALVIVRALLAPTPLPAALPTDANELAAIVESVASPREGRRPAVLRVETSGGPARIATQLPLVPRVRPGTTITVGGSIDDVPDGPYGGYLGRIGVSAILTTRSLRVVAATPDTPGAWLEDFRQATGDALAAALPEPAAGLASGIVIGLRDRVDRDLAGDFTTAGVSHVVAISGWNIAIVAGAVMAAASRIRRRRRVILALATIVLYTLFAGASASVVRAAAMASVALLARETGRPAVAAAALGWAVAILVITDPTMATDPGFQLSALGTAGLIAWADALEGRLRSMAGGRLPGWLAESLAISLAAQAATLPVVLATFGRLATVAPLVNLVVVPIIPPAMAACLVALGGGLAILAGLPEIVGVALGAPAWALLSLAIAVVRLGAGLPGASLAIDGPFDTLAGIATAVLLVAVWRRPFRLARPSRPGTGTPPARAPDVRSAGLPRRATVVGAVAISVAVTTATTAVLAAPDGALRIVVLDVGQGDAILLEGPRGSRMLIDGGPDPDRLRLRLDERLPPWDRRLETVVLTHPHEDHVAGLLALASRYNVVRFYEPGMHGPGPGYEAWRTGLADAGIVTRGLHAGDRLSLDGVALRVLWPDRGSVPLEPADNGTAINNVSIVLLGVLGRQRFLLTGDIEEEIDPVLLARGLPRVDVLKVAHHGSRTSSTRSFLAAARPSVAIVSAGQGNPYGHPTRATIGRLEATGATVLRTDQDGTVTVRLDGRTIGRGTTRTRAAATQPVGQETRRPLVASGFGCLIRPVTATRSSVASEPAGVEAALRYHPVDERWRIPRRQLGVRFGAHHPADAICERRPSTTARVRPRRR
jgi:competence protein ComEC